MIYKEIKKDIFSMPDKYYIVHSVSKDGAMGKTNKGEILPCFATEVLKRYPHVRKEFLKTNPSMPDCVQTGKIINLVDKNNYWDKPTYDTLKQSLVQLRWLIIKKDITYLTLPTIGSGMNRLSWQKVKKIIKNIFKDIEIEIVVCKLE